ncbi:chlorhexidine efflux transporter [Vibrio comitans]
MNQQTYTQPIRPLKSRLLRALTLEGGILLLVAPVFIDDFADINLVSGKILLLITAAIVWNAAYSFGFDTYLWKWQRSLEKTVMCRFVYALLFQVGLLVISAPIFFSMLDSSFWQVMSADLWFSTLVFAYTYFTNALYEKFC